MSAVDELARRVRILEAQQQFLGAGNSVEDPVANALGRSISVLQSFPGIRAIWTLGSFNGGGGVIDASGGGQTLTNSGMILDSATTDAPQSFFPNRLTYGSIGAGAGTTFTGTETFVRSGQSLRGATFGMWSRPNDVTNVHTLISKWNTTGNQREFILEVNNQNSGSVAFFAVSGNGGSTVSVLSPTVTVAGEWTFVCGVYNSEDQTIKIWKDGASAITTTNVPMNIFSGTADFRIGDAHGPTGIGLLGRGSMAFAAAAAVSDEHIKLFYNTSYPMYHNILQS